MALIRPSTTRMYRTQSSDELVRLMKKHNLALEFRECFEFVIDLGVIGVEYTITHILDDVKYVFTNPGDDRSWVHSDLNKILRSKCYSVMLEFWVGHNRVTICSRSGTNVAAYIINGTVAHSIDPNSKQFIIDYCRISYLYPNLEGITKSDVPKLSSADDNLKILGLYCNTKSSRTSAKKSSLDQEHNNE